MRTLLVLLALTGAAFAQRHKIEEIDTEKPDGKLLHAIMQENDAAKRTPLLEQFTTEYPKHEGMAWALEMLQESYAKAGDADKTIAAGDRLLALDPDDAAAHLENLKAAGIKKDPALIKKYGASTAAAARKLQATDAEAAKYFFANTDFVVYSVIASSRDPKVTIDLAETLIQQSPNGDYTPRAVQPLYMAYRQTNDTAKALALAERTLAAGQNDEDMLLFVADNYAQQKKDPAKIHDYCARAVTVLTEKPKPEGINDADWNARKTLILGAAHYMNGKLYYSETNFAKAEPELRAALPLLENNAALKPEVLFYLGFANYKLGKPQEAANYYRACAAIKSPHQANATKSLAGIKAEFTGIK